MIRVAFVALLGMIQAGGLLTMPPEPTDIPNECPALIFRRVGGLGTESTGGILVVLWESGAIVRAESPKRPSGSHVFGRLEPVDVVRVMDIVKRSPLWILRSQGLAVDLPSEELELQEPAGRRGWAETPGVTETRQLAELRDALFRVPIKQPIRFAAPVQEEWKCPTVRWSR